MIRLTIVCKQVPKGSWLYIENFWKTIRCLKIDAVNCALNFVSQCSLRQILMHMFVIAMRLFSPTRVVLIRFCNSSWSFFRCA